MPATSEGHKKKIILYYMLAIVLPCVFLGILAFRGIRNDQALMEREHLRTLQENAQEVISKTALKLDSVEEDLRNVLSAIPEPTQPVFSDSILNRFVKNESSVSGIFFVENNEIRLLNKGLLYLPDNYFEPDWPDFTDQNQKIRTTGWELEFRQKQYDKAEAYYQRVLPTIKDKRFAGEIANAIARNRKKQNKPGDALETYKLIFRTYPDVTIQDNIPLGMVGLLESAKINLSLGDTIETLKTCYRLLQNMKDSRWKIREGHFLHFRSEVQKLIEPVKTAEEIPELWLNRNRLLLDSLAILELQTNHVLNFIPAAASGLFNGQVRFENRQARFRYNVNGTSCLVATIELPEQKYGGIVYNQESILSNTVVPLIEKNTTADEFVWKIENPDGKILNSSENTSESEVFSRVFFPAQLPAWSLLFYLEDSSLLTSFFQTGEGIFFYIFVLIILILAFGLFFILKAVNNEMNLSKMKSHFITTVSHEFKSPLASIRQLGEMLEQNRVPTKERKQKYYRGIVQQSERLTHLIENILNYSKMEAHQKEFSFQKADIESVLKDVVASFGNFVSVNGFQIEYEKIGSVPEFYFDKEAMEQVFHNLLDNACKYSGDSKKVKVTLQKKDGNVTIGVKDYGVGMIKEDRDKIFSRFYRVGNELTRYVKGSGIGLTIVKQIVDAHNGKVVVESEVGKGSEFHVVLPFKPDPLAKSLFRNSGGNHGD